jgi:rhodanese-related sulfurtransferase
VQFVDARNPTAWSESQVKLPGAIRIPVDGAEAHPDAVPRDSTAIAYCT